MVESNLLSNRQEGQVMNLNAIDNVFKTDKLDMGIKIFSKKIQSGCPGEEWQPWVDECLLKLQEWNQ